MVQFSLVENSWPHEYLCLSFSSDFIYYKLIIAMIMHVAKIDCVFIAFIYTENSRRLVRQLYHQSRMSKVDRNFLI